MTLIAKSLQPCLRTLPGILLLFATGCTYLGTASRPAAPAVTAAQGAFDDDAHQPTSIEASVTAAGKDPMKLAALERELLAMMQSPGTAPLLVQEAAQHLGYVMQAGVDGPAPESLAVLAPMLTDPARVDHARLALDHVPGKRVDNLYLAALPSASGRVRLALTDSVASRTLAAAVPLLSVGLKDPDPAIATASAQALGRIGGPAALAALESAPNPVMPAVLNARLAAAEKVDAATVGRTAWGIYRNPAAPLAQRSAALRQLINAMPADAVAEIHVALMGTEPAFQAVALHAVSTLPVTGSAAILAGRLGSYAPAVQVALITALGVRGDAGAIPGLLSALDESDAGVRLVTLDALGRLPGTTEVARKLAVHATGTDAEGKAAFNSLARLNGPGVDEYIRLGATSGDPALRPVFIQQIAARNQTSEIPFLLSLRNSPSEPLRLEALDALRLIAPPASLRAIIDWALGTSSKAEQTRALRALVATILRDDDTNTRTDPVITAIKAGAASTRLALLPVLSRVPNPQTLAMAGSLALSSDVSVAAAAVTELARWPDAAALPLLVDVARQTQGPAVRNAAVLGAARFLSRGTDLSSTQRSAQARTLLGLPVGVSEKLALLNVLSLCADQPALKTAQRFVGDPATAKAARDAVDAITSNLAGAPSCTASNSVADLPKMFDGKSDTFWSVPGTPGEWLNADLHHSRPVRKVTLDQKDRGWDFPATLEVFVSDDPAQQGVLRVQTEGERGKTVITLPLGVRGRYLWLRQTGTRSAPWSITELLVE